MGLDEKIASAKESTWLKDLYTDSEWETQRVCSIISLEIEKARINSGMNQMEFAKFMGVSQGMVSKWESGDYNFTIEALARIGNKLGRSVESLLTPNVASKYNLYANINGSLQKQSTEAVFAGLINKNELNEIRSKNKYRISQSMTGNYSYTQGGGEVA